VRQQEGELQAGDHEVLVVAGVGDRGPEVVAEAGQVLEPPTAAHQELGRVA
jgi:hypothetical protein